MLTSSEIRDSMYFWLLHENHIYSFDDSHGSHPGRKKVVARRSIFGGVWLLCEQLNNQWYPRYWVMPDGGIGHLADAARGGGQAALSLVPSCSHVLLLQDESEIDPDLRAQLDDLLRGL